MVYEHKDRTHRGIFYALIKFSNWGSSLEKDVIKHVCKANVVTSHGFKIRQKGFKIVFQTQM